MEMCYDGALVMPREFAVMDEEEMTYTEGGKTIAYRIHYAATSGAMTAAALFHLKGQFKGLSLYDLAAEIWFHAYAYYSALPMASLCSVLGYDGIENTKLWRSLKNGIDIGSTKDCEKEFGVCRYVIFRAAYTYAVANPYIL
ncbi:MAG: hypothetical protein K6F17_08085 [Lachnospiraceae bacterium]|nr:hypothetical protein [Lachnospiraceae bacterium]